MICWWNHEFDVSKIMLQVKPPLFPALKMPILDPSSSYSSCSGSKVGSWIKVNLLILWMFGNFLNFRIFPVGSNNFNREKSQRRLRCSDARGCASVESSQPWCGHLQENWEVWPAGSEGKSQKGGFCNILFIYIYSKTRYVYNMYIISKFF